MPALLSPAFVASARAPSSSISPMHAHTHAHLFRITDSGTAALFQTKIENAKSMDNGIVLGTRVNQVKIHYEQTRI